MKRKSISASLIAGITALLVTSTGWSALLPYSQDFNGLDAANPDALGFAGDSWGIFGSVFDGDLGAPPNGNFKFQYGVFSAPNGPGGFSNIESGEGQGGPLDQYLNIFSDYGCCGPGTTDEGHFDQSAPFDRVQSIVLRDQTIMASDIGVIWQFSFDAKQPSGGIGCSDTATSACNAFIKTLDPGAGFATTNFIPFDSGTLSNNAWSSHSLQIDLSDPLLVGQIIQVGFESISEQFGNSGVYYDNISFDFASATSTIGAAGGTLSAPGVTVTIAAGALAGDIDISIVNLGRNLELDVAGFGTSISIAHIEALPAGTNFSQPATLVFSWQDADNDGFVDNVPGSVPESAMRIFKDGSAITQNCNSETSCDQAANTFTVTTNSFSEFLLFGPADSDSDGVRDNYLAKQDNCTLVPNGPAIPDAGGNSQLDSNGDGFGNACDADFNGDCVVNGLDVGPFVAQFGTTGPDADFNGDDVVNGLDVGPFVDGFGKAPGPSGEVPVCVPL